MVPAIKYLNRLLSHSSNNRLERINEDIISILVNSHDLVAVLVDNITVGQLDTWTKTSGRVQIDTLIDERFTYKEYVESHLDLLSLLLKQGKLYLILRRAENLWDLLINNEKACSFERELGLDWFIKCIDDLNSDSQCELFKQRISKLVLTELSSKGKIYWNVFIRLLYRYF